MESQSGENQSRGWRGGVSVQRQHHGKDYGSAATQVVHNDMAGTDVAPRYVKSDLWLILVVKLTYVLPQTTLARSKLRSTRVQTRRPSNCVW